MPALTPASWFFRLLVAATAAPPAQEKKGEKKKRIVSRLSSLLALPVDVFCVGCPCHGRHGRRRHTTCLLSASPSSSASCSVAATWLWGDRCTIVWLFDLSSAAAGCIGRLTGLSVDRPVGQPGGLLAGSNELLMLGAKSFALRNGLPTGFPVRQQCILQSTQIESSGRPLMMAA